MRREGDETKTWIKYHKQNRHLKILCRRFSLVFLDTFLHENVDIKPSYYSGEGTYHHYHCIWQPGLAPPFYFLNTFAATYLGVSVGARWSGAPHAERSRATLTCIQSGLARSQRCCCCRHPYSSAPPPPRPPRSCLCLFPLPLTAAGGRAGRADGILASRMTLALLPLVLILRPRLSKPNPTLARAAGPLPVLLLSTQRLFTTARVLASSSGLHTHTPNYLTRQSLGCCPPSLLSRAGLFSRSATCSWHTKYLPIALPAFLLCFLHFWVNTIHFVAECPATNESCVNEAELYHSDKDRLQTLIETCHWNQLDVWRRAFWMSIYSQQGLLQDNRAGLCIKYKQLGLDADKSKHHFFLTNRISKWTQWVSIRKLLLSTDQFPFC